MLKWAIKLASYGIIFVPRRAIKTQALANFIAECPVANEPQEIISKAWMLYVDESATNARRGAGLIVISAEGHSYDLY